MKNIKKILAVVLIAAICVFSASCAENSTMVISENGAVEVSQKIEMTEAEYKKIDAIGALAVGDDEKIDTGDISGLDNLGPVTSNLFKNSKTMSELISNFKKACKQEKRDNGTYYVYEDTAKYNSVDEVNKISGNNAKFTIGDAWYATMDKKTYNQAMAMYTIYGIDVSIQCTLKMPYKITKTNCEKVDDYTVKLNNCDVSYVITEKSTSDWAKAADPISAIKTEVRTAIKPAKVTGVKVIYKDYRTAKVTFNSVKDQNLTYVLEYKTKGMKKWRQADSTVDKENYITDFLSNEKKTISYRVKAYATSLALGDEEVYGAPSAAKTLKTIKFDKPVVKATADKKAVKLTLTKKIKKLKGYEIKYSTKSNLKGAKKVTVKKLPNTIKKLKSGKKYFIKVRQFTKQGKNKVYGPYSKKLTVKVK